MSLVFYMKTNQYVWLTVYFFTWSWQTKGHRFNFLFPPKSLHSRSSWMRPTGLSAAQCTIGCRCARKVSAGRFWSDRTPTQSEVSDSLVNTWDIQCMEEAERRGKPGQRGLRNYAEQSLWEGAGPGGNRGGPHEGMPKRRADTRPEHQTWVRGKTVVRDRAAGMALRQCVTLSQ